MLLPLFCPFAVIPSRTFCFVSSWWPVALMGGTLGWGWQGVQEEAEQLKLLTELLQDPVA